LTLDNQPVATVTGTVHFDPISGGFSGTIGVNEVLVKGPYAITVHVDQYLSNPIPGNPIIIPGQTNEIFPVDLVAGDINNDGKVNIRDYSVFLDCYNSFRAATNCDAAKKAATDLNDDGLVNDLDNSLLLREIRKQKHE